MTTVIEAPLVADLRRLVEAESPSDDAAALRACGDVLDELLTERTGIPAQVREDGSLLWRPDGRSVRNGSRSDEVLVLGHLDTVWPLGTLERLPFEVAGDRVRGPGTFDMKGGLVVVVHAVARLLDEGRLPPMTLLVTSDEEVGSHRSAEEVAELSRRCRKVLVAEPSGPGGAVKTARNGVAMGRLVATGLASHAGLAPREGVNAVVGLGGVLPQVVALSDERSALSVTPTVVRGGTAINAVPAHAEVHLDVRFLDPKTVDRLCAELAQLAAPGGAELEVELSINRPALPPRASAPLLPALHAAAAAAGQEIATTSSGGASDGNLAAAAGAAVLDGLGPAGDGAHADHEHVSLAGLSQRVALLAALLPLVAQVAVP